MKVRFALLAATAAFSQLSFDVDAQGRRRGSEPPQPTQIKITGTVPTLAVSPETREMQAKGGVTITVTPFAYTAEVATVPSLANATPNLKESVMLVHQPTDIFVERTMTPMVVVQPERLQYRVHINNQLSRVFRGAGTIVQFMVAGKTASVDPSGYGDLVNVIIPPRAEQDLIVYGPALGEIPDGATVGLFLFDVVTKTDNAGNVTEKQNFEWYFSYRTQIVEKDVTVMPPDRLWVSPALLQR